MGPVAGAQGASPATSSPGWERWLPTIGSVAGSVGGDILGTAAAPFTGGIVNPWDTSTALSGLLAGGGQALENGLQGKNPFQMNDITQGAIGAGSNLAGFGLGKLLGMGGTALGNVGAGMAEKSATEGAAQTAADELTATKNAFGGINSGTQIANNLKDNQALMSGFGHDITSPEAMSQTAQGGNLINQVDQEALSQGNPIKTSSLLSSSNVVNLSQEEQQALLDSGIIDNGSFSQLPDTITPTQADSFAQSLGAQEREARTLMENARLNAPDKFNGLKTNFNRATMIMLVKEMAANRWEFSPSDPIKLEFDPQSLMVKVSVDELAESVS